MRKEETTDVTDLQDIWPILHDEVNRLPDKFRTPVVLCYLDGKTNEEAASQLNWPVGTVKTRLSQGRDILKDRLQRRGVVLPMGLLGAALVSEAQAEAAVSTALMEATVRAASLLSAGKTPAAAGLSAQVNILADSAIHSLFLAKLKAIAATVVFALGLASMTGGLCYYHTQTPEGLPGLSYFKPLPDVPADTDSFVPSQPQQATGGTYSGPSTSTYGTQTTTYPQANPGPTATEGTVSSRQAAQQNDSQPPSREEQYNKLLQENQKQKATQGKTSPDIPANPQPSPKPSTSEQPAVRPVLPQPVVPGTKDPPASRWWEAIWLPW